ncbi:hypothetical protein FQ775_01145 [Nitratireductor mangrovi]|uniref:Uncharacterized protein n=1 Tax=Nitratireductor mangrovi TaxID=2599600 RepID=A0A5B8KU63_9HYPH|nr:hypothetical protein [Nitratireductor mangrovi]QDY99087.1 hypothetical protein FQ775_01145 [Nitratireductor mangrovi]
MPTDLKLVVSGVEPLLRGQDHFWKVIRTLGADGRTFSASAVSACSQEPHTGTITTFLRRLHLAGIVADTGERQKAANGRQETLWQLAKSPEATPIVSRDGTQTRQRSAQQQMWNIMRGTAGRAGFTYRDLIALGSTDDLEIADNTAKSFIQQLSRAGYLQKLDAGGPGRPARWRLRPAMNSGPLPPKLLRAKLVYDQNRERVTGDVIAEEDAR